MRPNEILVPSHLVSAHNYLMNELVGRSNPYHDEEIGEQVRTMKEWCSKHLSETIHVTLDDDFQYTFLFGNQADMMLFTLKWF